MVYCVYEAAKDVCQKHRASFHMGSPYWPMYITTSSLPGSASGSTNFRGLPHLPKGRIGRPLGIERCRPVLPLPQRFRECRYSWSHGSVGSPFCTDYINSVLPVPAKLPLLMGCADCTKISNKIWSHGSVGRAHRSHRWGHRFESCCDHHAPGRQNVCQVFSYPTAMLERM